jgi:hypothetical protein
MTRIQDEIARMRAERSVTTRSESERRALVRLAVETIVSRARRLLSDQRETAMFKVNTKWHEGEADLYPNPGSNTYFVRCGFGAVIDVLDETDADSGPLTVWYCTVHEILQGGVLLQFDGQHHILNDVISKTELEALAGSLSVKAARFYVENEKRLKSKRPWF